MEWGIYLLMYNTRIYDTKKNLTKSLKRLLLF